MPHSFLRCLLLPVLALSCRSAVAQTDTLAPPLPANVSLLTPPLKPAPDTSQPFGLTDDAELVYRVLGPDGKPAGELRQRVVELSTQQREESKKRRVLESTALVKSGRYSRKNVLERMQDLTFRARRDTSFTDGMGEINHDVLRSFRDRKLVYEAVPLAWPNQPTVGTTLPAGGVTIKVSSSVVSIATVSTTLRQRRVASGPAPLLTPAGTFQCYRVEAEREDATVPRPDMAMRSSSKQIDYYAPGVGIIRTERYGKNGKLSEVRELMARNTAGQQTKEKVKTKKP